MDIFANLDLLSVGITIAGIGLLGFAIYFTNPKSITNQSFLLFSIITIFWGIANYLNYKFEEENLVLLMWRLVIFFATWHAYSLFQLVYSFPNDHVEFSKKYKYILLPIVIVSSAVTLTPLAFVKITKLASLGEPSTVEKGPGMLVFIVVVLFLILSSFYFLIKKSRTAQGIEKKQLTIVFSGLIITFFLLVTFNFLLPALFDALWLSPLGAIFILPFIVFTAYAIYKHKLFNIRDTVTIFISFALTIVTFLEIVFSNDLYQIVFRSSIFILVLIFSIQLIRNMLRLEQANQRLKELDQLKSEFVSLATHQIRAPLAAIKGYISEIFEGDFGQYPKELDKPLNIVMQSTENLVNIVGDFLNISRIEQGRMVYDFSTFDISKMLEEVGNELKPNIERAKLDFSVNIEPGKYMVSADIGKMRQIISNLIDNSIKYTKQGWIKVGIKNNISNNVLIFIKDTGVGITPETMPKLFQKFSRAKDANQTNVIGTGLGLYVVKTMVEAQHGRVWAESEGSGKGSTFYVELPVVLNN